MHIYLRTHNLIKAFNEYNINPTIGAEVGVKIGRNAYGLLHLIPKLNLILIDNYCIDQKDKNGNCVVYKGASQQKEVVDKKIKKYSDRVIWILKPSVEAAKEVKDKSLDYAFIDAEHTYEAVKEDIEAWLPKVKIGGLLAGHDFAPSYDGLKRAVKERFGSSFNKNLDVWYIQVTENLLKDVK